MLIYTNDAYRRKEKKKIKETFIFALPPRALQYRADNSANNGEPRGGLH